MKFALKLENTELKFSLFLIRNSALGSLLGAGVGLGALTAAGKSFAVTHASVASDFLEALDVHGDFSAEITFHHIVLADDLADAPDFFICEVAYARVGVDFCSLKDLVRAGPSDTENIGKAYLYSLISG